MLGVGSWELGVYEKGKKNSTLAAFVDRRNNEGSFTNMYELLKLLENSIFMFVIYHRLFFYGKELRWKHYFSPNNRGWQFFTSSASQTRIQPANFYGWSNLCAFMRTWEAHVTAFKRAWDMHDYFAEFIDFERHALYNLLDLRQERCEIA